MQSAGAFCYLNNYAKGLQPPWCSWFYHFNRPGGDGRDGLHADPVNDETVSEQHEVGADGDNPQSSPCTKGP